MARRLSGLNPLSYIGVEPLSPPQFLVKRVDPTANDNNFNLGTMWLNEVNEDTFLLTSKSGGTATWSRFIPSGAGAAIDFVTASGTATPAAGILNVPAGSNITTAGAGDTLTINLVASPSVAGSLTAGTTITAGTGLTVTAGGITAAGTITLSDLNLGVVVSDAAGILSAINGTNGQLLIGGTAIAPIWADLTSTGGTITITGGANTLNIETAGTTANSFPTDSGTAIPAAGALTIAGGANIATSGAASTVTIDVSGTTDHALQLGNATGSLTSLGVATDGQLPIGSTGLDPVLATLTAGTDINIVNGPGSITINSTASPGAIQFDGDAGSAVPAAGIITMAGGSNISTSAAGSTVTYNVSGTTDHAIQLGNAGGSLTSLGVATDGQIPIGATGTDPSLNTITPGTGISIANAPGAITISATGSQLPWTVVAGAAQALAINNGYFSNNAGLCTFTLPAVASVGDVIEVALMNATGSWTIAQNAGQTLYIGNTNTTTGAGGSLSSTDKGDWLEIICRVANTDFQVNVKSGNITVV